MIPKAYIVTWRRFAPIGQIIEYSWQPTTKVNRRLDQFFPLIIAIGIDAVGAKSCCN